MRKMTNEKDCVKELRFTYIGKELANHSRAFFNKDFQ